jgi:hypothetical protein
MILSLCGIGRLQLLRVPGEELLIQTTICGYVARRGANQQNDKTWGCNRKSSQKIGRLTVETHLTGTIAGIFTRTVVANGHMNNHCVGLRLKLHLRDGSSHLFIRVKAATTRDQTKPCKPRQRMKSVTKRSKMRLISTNIWGMNHAANIADATNQNGECNKAK